MNVLALPRKLGQAARVLSSARIWRIVLDDRGCARGLRGPSPAVRVAEEDDTAGLRRVEVDEQSYWLPITMDWRAMPELYSEVFCEDHPHYYEHAGCKIGPGDVVVDAGASEGLFTRFALLHDARVVVVEPWQPMVIALRRTFEKEIAEGRVSVVHALLGNASGEAVLEFDPTYPWGAKVIARRDEGASCEVVRQVTIDELVASSPWGRCDFLKMDIEGSERPALAGAGETLRRYRPCLSIAVYHHLTGYLDLSHDLRSMGLDYRIEGKGIQRRRGLPVPMILHAWRADVAEGSRSV
jgi:FkbM family methyltransferase